MTRRVAILTSSYPAFDGDPSGHFVESEARELAANGSDVTVVAPGTSGDSYARGVEVVRVGGGDLFGWPGVAARLAEKPWRVASLPRWMVRARAAIEASRADELLAHWAVPNAWPLALHVGMPVHVVSHGTDVRMILRVPEPLRSRLVEAIAESSSSWRFVSEALYEDLRTNLRTPIAARLERTAQVAPSPIDLPDVTDAARRKRAHITEDALFVVAARLVPAKRVDACLRWLATAETARSKRLVILGDGPERKPLEALAAALGLRVTFLGTVPRLDALAWIVASDGVLHASKNEGLSTVCREATHYGRRLVLVD